MRMKNRNKSSLELPQKLSADSIPQQPNSYEGESLLHLLNSIQREIKSVRVSDESLPYKIWLKQQFSIGVNDVTRVLERMPPVHGSITSLNVKASSLQMQAILIATDCNPRSLTKHLPILASFRGVSVIFVKDKKGGSFKLSEIVNLKTAMAIGIKDQESHCEGKERVERHELFMKWRPRFMMAGFTQCPLSSYVNSVIKNLLKCYSENYMLVENDGAMLLGWKERNLISASAWH